MRKMENEELLQTTIQYIATTIVNDIAFNYGDGSGYSLSEKANSMVDELSKLILATLNYNYTNELKEIYKSRREEIRKEIAPIARKYATKLFIPINYTNIDIVAKSLSDVANKLLKEDLIDFVLNTKKIIEELDKEIREKIHDETNVWIDEELQVLTIDEESIREITESFILNLIMDDFFDVYEKEFEQYSENFIAKLYGGG